MIARIAHCLKKVARKRSWKVKDIYQCQEQCCKRRMFWWCMETNGNAVAAESAFQPARCSGRDKKPAHTLHGRDTKKNMRERVSNSISSDVLRSSGDSQLPRKFTDLDKIYSDKAEMSLEFMPLFSYQTLWV